MEVTYPLQMAVLTGATRRHIPICGIPYNNASSFQNHMDGSVLEKNVIIAFGIEIALVFTKYQMGK
jgi:hypothetical protein